MGAWIETSSLIVGLFSPKVAPYVGAWIETVLTVLFSQLVRSHPTWVRGLKLLFSVFSWSSRRRTLRGCVD